MSTNIISIFKIPGMKSATTLLSSLQTGGNAFNFEENSIHAFKRQLMCFKCTDYIEFKNSWNGPLHTLSLLNVKPHVQLDIDGHDASIYAFSPRQVKSLYKHFKTNRISKKLVAEDRWFLTCMKETVSAWSSTTFSSTVIVCFEALGACVGDEEIREASKVDLFKTNGDFHHSGFGFTDQKFRWVKN